MTATPAMTARMPASEYPARPHARVAREGAMPMALWRKRLIAPEAVEARRGGIAARVIAVWELA
jgi:hypothetical protein